MYCLIGYTLSSRNLMKSTNSLKMSSSLGTASNQMVARHIILCVTTQVSMFGDSCICLII